MKKITVLSLALTSALFAVSDAQIKSLYSNLTEKGVSVSVKERKSLKEDSSVERIVVEIKQGKEVMNDLIFAKGDLIFPDVINLKEKRSYKQEFQMEEDIKMMEAGVANLAKEIKAEDKSKIITLGNDPKKPTRFLFTDPLCPYCRMELKNIEKELEIANIKVFLTPIQSHGKDALARSIKILEESSSAKTDAQKIEILRKYYSNDTKISNQPSDDQISKHKNFADKYFSTGAIRGVPAMFEEQKDGKLIVVEPMMGGH